ncbi:MAG: PDZ domain-containing protein [Acidobacteriia bacterium]|nr:PDZ domain-containing protein [Terriglobia bacterium]
MKRYIIIVLGSLVVVALLGIASLGAGKDSAKARGVVAVSGDEPDVLYFNAEDEEEPPVAAPTPHPGPGVVARPHPGRKTIMFHALAGDGAWLGLRLEDVTAEKAKELKLAGEYGVIVKDVEEESPAAKAGVAKGDVILEFAGEKVRSAAHLRRLVRETPAGRSVTLLVSRAGQTRTLTAKLEAGGDRTFQLPAMPPMPDMPGFDIKIPEFDFVWHARGAQLGISADELTPQLAQYFGVKQGMGILVREVVVGSAAEKAGLKAGDVIVQVDGKDVDTVGKLRRALAGEKETQEARKVTLTIVRDKREQTLTVELEPQERMGPRRMTRTELMGVDPVEMQEIAAEAQAYAKEMEAQAREWQKEHQELQKEQQRLQEEMQRLQQELPKQIEREIIREDVVTGLKGER